MKLNPESNPDAEGITHVENLAENPSYFHWAHVHGNVSCQTSYSIYQKFLVEVIVKNKNFTNHLRERNFKLLKAFKRNHCYNGTEQISNNNY